MNKGQITTSILIASAIGLGGLIFSLFGYNLLANNKTDSQVQTVVRDVSEKSERIAKTETAIIGFDKRLESIEKKLDRLLELQGKR